MYINDNIRILRHKRRLSQKELSDLTGIKRHNIDAYESKRANPPLDTLPTLSDFFKISIDDLIRKDLTKID